MNCNMPDFPVLHYLLEFAQLMSIESLMPSNRLNLCCSHFLFSVFPSIGVSSSELALCIRWPKYWSFNFSISPSSEYSGLISFRIDWFDLLAVQGTLKSFLQCHSLKATVWKFDAQPSLWSTLTSVHYYWKNHIFDYWTFVIKVMSLLFNKLSRLVIAFLPRSMAVVTVCSYLGAHENKICHCFHFFPIYLPWSDGTGCQNL